MQTLLHDIRYAARSLIKTSGFALIVVITLALGIGANTAIFSLVNTFLFRSLPFEQSNRLVELHRGDWDDLFSYPDYLEYRHRSDALDELACWSYLPVSVGRGERNELRFGQIVTGNYFAALGGGTTVGRALTKQDIVAPLLACYIPAQRATKVYPMVALRCE